MDPFADEDSIGLLNPQEKPWNFRTKFDAPLIRRKAVFGFSSPLTFKWFVSVVGTEYCHTYFWIAKDLAWMQGHRDYSIFFGLCALGWSLVVLYHALRTVNWHEIWNFIALFLWLFANFIWMRGEAHDHTYPEELPVAVECSDISALILSAAFLWLLVYYVAFLPFNLIHSSKASLLEYDDGQMRPRCAMFRNFRQYENLHMLFWISKDLAWNRSSLAWWLIFLFPTLFISADLLVIALTSNSTEYTLDVVHYGVTLLWVLANSVWAFGDFFVEKYDEPLGIWDNSEETLMTARWYSAWILFLNVCVVFLMYGLWATLTLTGRIAASNPTEELLAHKHSMTGLNLSAGNGILVYENDHMVSSSGGSNSSSGNNNNSNNVHGSNAMTTNGGNYIAAMNGNSGSSIAVSGALSISNKHNYSLSGGNVTQRNVNNNNNNNNNNNAANNNNSGNAGLYSVVPTTPTDSFTDFIMGGVELNELALKV